MNGASKSYAMTGWRIGWACGSKEIITAMSNYQSQSVSCAAAVSQHAAVEAVTNSDKQVAGTVEKLKQRCEFIVGELGKIKDLGVFRPDGAFYLWIDISKFLGKRHNGKVMHSSADVSLALLEDQLVAVVPGVEFGLEGFLRLSYVLENPRAKEAVDRMGHFFEALV
jgi:aspartate aminotransferase